MKSLPSPSLARLGDASKELFTHKGGVRPSVHQLVCLDTFVINDIHSKAPRPQHKSRGRGRWKTETGAKCLQYLEQIIINNPESNIKAGGCGVKGQNSGRGRW